MLTPDLALARRFVASQDIPGRPLVVAITGAHLYGFPSPDSDLDLKGFHLAPTEALLGLAPKTDAVDRIADFEGVECDLTSHELGKALGLLLSGNGNVLEQIHSPLQLFESPELEALRTLARRTLSRRVLSHYRGFFRGVQREHGLCPRVKSMLYAYRVALTGIHVLRTGEVEANLAKLAPLYGFAEVLTLVEMKGAGAEKAGLPSEEDARFRMRWQELEVLFEDALATSPLPAEPEHREELEVWLLELRIRELDRRRDRAGRCASD